MNTSWLTVFACALLLAGCGRGTADTSPAGDTNDTGNSTEVGTSADTGDPVSTVQPADGASPGAGTGTADGTTRPGNPGAPIDQANRAPPETSAHLD